MLALRIVTTAMPTAGCNQPYTLRFLAAGGSPEYASPPYTWTLVSGPAGATLDPDGTFRLHRHRRRRTCLPVTVRLSDLNGGARRSRI